MSICGQKITNQFCVFCTKSSIDRMIKCAKKFVNQLTKWVNMLKGCLHQGGKSFGGRVCVRITSIFSFPTHICPFCPINYERLQNVFNIVTNKDKIETQNALCNFSKSPYICKLLIVWLGALCGLCILLIYKLLAFCSCE